MRSSGIGLRAPDWRGFGRSAWSQEGYGFADYLAISTRCWMCSAGFAPARWSATVWAATSPACTRACGPSGCAAWSISRVLVCRAPAGGSAETIAQMAGASEGAADGKELQFLRAAAAIIEYRYPRFHRRSRTSSRGPGRRSAPDGRIRLLGDSRHRWVNPILYKREEAEACWRAIERPSHVDAARSPST